jgi:hypothetical protein
VIAYSDAQLFVISTAAKDLPPEKRSLYLQRVNAFLETKRGGLFTDQDVDVAIKTALAGLVHHHYPAT